MWVWTVSSLRLLAPGLWWVDVWRGGSGETSATGDAEGRSVRLPQQRPQVGEGGKVVTAGFYCLQFDCSKKLESRSRCQGAHPGRSAGKGGSDDGRGRQPHLPTPSVTRRTAGPDQRLWGGARTSARRPPGALQARGSQRGWGFQPTSRDRSARLERSIVSTPSWWSLAAWKWLSQIIIIRFTSENLGRRETRRCMAESFCCPLKLSQCG